MADVKDVPKIKKHRFAVKVEISAYFTEGSEFDLGDKESALRLIVSQKLGRRDIQNHLGLFMVERLKVLKRAR